MQSRTCQRTQVRRANPFAHLPAFRQLLLVLAKYLQTLPQHHQRLVDIASFLQTVASRVCILGPLTAGEVDNAEAGHIGKGRCILRIRPFRKPDDLDGEDRVRTRGGAIQAGRKDLSIDLSLLVYGLGVLVRPDPDLLQTVDVLVASLAV